MKEMFSGTREGKGKKQATPRWAARPDVKRKTPFWDPFSLSLSLKLGHGMQDSIDNFHD